LHTDLRHLQALPRDGKAITNWANVDAAWQDVTDGIRRVVQSLRAETVAPSSLTQAQKQVLATFMDRRRRVGEGLRPNVFIGDRDAMDAIAQFVKAGALTYGKNNFILLTERGYRLAMELAKAD
jgi:hypothetical protein